MNEAISDNIFKSYTLDYVGKYHFYEEEEFIEAVKDGEYILENLKEIKLEQFKGEEIKAQNQIVYEIVSYKYGAVKRSEQ